MAIIAAGMTSSPPRILLTNDDGIHAPGLKALERIAKELSNDIWIVAPETEQSGVAHSLSLHTPVRTRKITARRHAVTGTPTDCVLLAKQAIVPAKKPIELVLSGVNRGSNVGDDITYSGTVAGAMEGALLGIPSIALSLLPGKEERFYWETAVARAPALIHECIALGWPKNTLININFPACTPEQVKGVRVAPQGKRVMSVGLHPRVDPKNRPYFWIGGERENTSAPNVDVSLLDEGYITVTPLTLDLTDHATLKTFRAALDSA